MPDLNNPADALQRGKSLLGLLGSFWSSVYGGRDQVSTYTDGLNQSSFQTYRDLMELVACTSRFDVPIYHKSNWTLLTIKQSSQTLTPVGLTHTYDYRPPVNLNNVSVIVNRISDPSVTLINDVDYIVDTTVPSIRFRDDPFNNPLLLVTPIYDSSGNLVDKQTSLWLFMGDYDWSLIYEQFGYVLGLYLTSSENYKTLLNVIWDAIIKSSSFANLKTVLAILTDTGLVKEVTETVVDITIDESRLLIITDKHVYEFSTIATPTVTIGQTLSVGDSLVDAFTIYNPYYDDLPTDKIPSITVSKDLLMGTYIGGLTFSNTDTDLVVSNVSSRTKVTFALGGDSTDISNFWAAVHTNGIAMGAISLAQLMDQRYPPAQSPDPTAVNLPLTVNPLTFLVKNILRNNAVIVTINEDSFGPNDMWDSQSSVLRQIVSPQNTVFIID